MSVSVELSRIQADAMKLEPARAAAWLVALPFLILGYAARIVWVAVALAIEATKAGWKAGTAHLEQAQTPRGGP